VGAAPTGHHDLPALQVTPVGCPEGPTHDSTTISMTTDPSRQRVTRLDFKVEGESREGLPIGRLTDEAGNLDFPDGRWVTKAEALRIARDLRAELDDW
jgi:hypothetical protein